MEKIILNNDRQILSFPDLYEKYAHDIFRYTLSILKDEDNAKDAVQETFVKYLENENSFRRDCSQKTWLLVIARNYCYSRLRRADNANGSINDDDFDVGYENKFDEEISLKEALKFLSPEQNELLFLKEYGGYSYKEIAEITGTTLENVKIKLFRVRQRLRNILKGNLL